MIIGLTGKAGAGKDTVGEHLRKTYGCSIMAFADPIKDMARALFKHTPVDSIVLDYRETKEAPIEFLFGASPRRITQTIGTEWGRELIHPDLWIHIARYRLEKAKQANSGNWVVVTDVRFDNEAELIRDLGGQVWSVVRPGAAAIDYGEHISEYGIARHLIHSYIENAGSIQVLYQMADELVDGIARAGRLTPREIANQKNIEFKDASA